MSTDFPSTSATAAPNIEAREPEILAVELLLALWLEAKSASGKSECDGVTWIEWATRNRPDLQAVLLGLPAIERRAVIISFDELLGARLDLPDALCAAVPTTDICPGCIEARLALWS